MKKLLNILLLVTFPFGYLEWGNNNHRFIFQSATDIFKKAGDNIENILHPFILIPFAGIVLLIYTLFQKVPGRKLTYTALACLSTLMLLLFLIGIMGLNFKMLLSTIPFLTVGVIVILKFRKKMVQD